MSHLKRDETNTDSPLQRIYIVDRCHAHATNPLDLLCLIDYKFTVEMLCYGYRCDCKSLHIFLEKETLVEACSN